MKKTLLALVCAVTLFLPNLLQAVDPCRTDINRLCGRRAQRHYGGTIGCLEANISHLSPECRARLARRQPQREAEPERRVRRENRREESAIEARRACVDDKRRYCPRIKGWDAAVSCLRGHARELSRDCKAKLGY